jgi:acyl-CoA hydrolase
MFKLLPCDQFKFDQVALKRGGEATVYRAVRIGHNVDYAARVLSDGRLTIEEKLEIIKKELEIQEYALFSNIKVSQSSSRSKNLPDRYYRGWPVVHIDRIVKVWDT